jgi:glycosyltransferase involved in cell wall biosynthesis
MYVVCIGNFASKINGQSIRSNNIVALLKSKDVEVASFDTSNKFAFIRSLNYFVITLSRSDALIIMLGRNGIRYLLPFLFLFGKFYKVKIVLVPIGGWLDELISQSFVVRYFVGLCDYILPQTDRLKVGLKKICPRPEIVVLTNFRIINSRINGKQSSLESSSKEFRVIFHARVCKEKGVSLLLDLANRLEAIGKLNICFDIFGPVQKDFEHEFQRKLTGLDSVKFHGPLDTNTLYAILPTYNLSILPTFYPGEGFPGSILDAYNCGVPVLTTRWLDIAEYVVEGQTGFLVEPNNLETLYTTFISVFDRRDMLHKLRPLILEHSRKYSSEAAYSILIRILATRA